MWPVACVDLTKRRERREAQKQVSSSCQNASGTWRPGPSGGSFPDYSVHCGLSDPAFGNLATSLHPGSGGELFWPSLYPVEAGEDLEPPWDMWPLPLAVREGERGDSTLDAFSFCLSHILFHIQFLCIPFLRKEGDGRLFLWWQPQGRGWPCVSPNYLVHMR